MMRYKTTEGDGMRNILSFTRGIFSGEEIIEWANHHSTNNTSHKREANRILRVYGNIRKDMMYTVHPNYEGSGCGNKVRKLILIRVK